jgi:hypothetical protein
LAEVNDVAKDAPFGTDEDSLAMMKREEIAVQICYYSIFLSTLSDEY